MPLPGACLRRFPAWIAILTALAAPLSVLAQDWPARPVRIVVPFPAGGTSDVLARTLGQALSTAWGQPVVVENRPGANGNIGAGMVVRSPADGYTLLLTDVGALSISPSVYPALAFDPLKDLAPVAMISYSPHVVAVHPSVPAQSLQELIALARSRPGRLNYATAGAGSASHLAGIDLATRAGIEWTYIHYKGGSQAVTDAVAGHADIVVNGMLPVSPHMKNGRLRALAVTSAKRVGAAPRVPTVAETAAPGFLSGSWQGLLAPAGTPPAIVNQANAEIRKALARPGIATQLAQQGTESRAGSPQALGEFLRTEVARWARVVKQAGVKAE
ncbi:MAG TPA: tripartite tricarboxylate transporter substrate binding protein [Burkholderiales bacterium]|nr:tripartite tricarboxylate transporter substrate binding protein [Burkholderiales bacterium]